MTLAAILSLSFFILSGSTAGGPAFASPPSLRESATQDQNNPPAVQTKPAPPTNPQPAPATSPEPQDSPAPAKKRPHHKKTSTPDCSPAPAPLKPPGNTPNGTAGPGNAQSAPPASANTKNPCPPPKVVVKDGGSDEPTIELTRGTSEQQASQQRYTTEQLRTATEENLKKLAGRQLTASQQEMVTQIKQFMDQAKSAVADEDLERGHSLAMKAHLLSEELLKP
ncbi:MAG: hypothetical protein WBM24_10180 [Candidatus Sulfotelmatobacter sp.]